MGLPQNRIKRALYQGSTSLLSAGSAMLLRVYQATLQVDFRGVENLLLQNAAGRNYIIAVWHTFIDAAVFAFHSHRLLVYSDHPRLDGYEKSWAHFFREIGIKTLRAYGFDVLDASLGKQSAGIINFVKKIKEGVPALIAPDGPQGPIYEAKPGTIYIAAKTSSVVIPVGFGLSRRITGPNWDDFALPLPFSRLQVEIGEPLEVPTKLTPELQDEYSKRLESELDKLCHRANAKIFSEDAP